MQNLALNQEGFVRPKELLKIIPISKSTLYSWIKDKRFPKPIKLGGGRASAFPISSVREFIQKNQIQSESNKKGGQNA